MDELLDGLNPNQKQAVLHKDGACVVIAGAGSGKTAVFTRRIANLIKQGVRADSILGMTFTKKASEEMKDRLGGLIGVEAEEVALGTFHSIFLRILKGEWEAKNNSLKNADIADDYWHKNTLKKILSPSSNRNREGLGISWLDPKGALSFIGTQKNNLIHPDGTLIIPSGLEQEEDNLRQMYKLYEKAKWVDNKIDFDDMLIMAYDMLKEEPELLGKCRDRFKYVLVDEFQDTNLAQYEILRLLAGEHKNLFVVGDDKQSIYGFRASRVELILNFEQDWDARVIHLDTNYRSTANIVEWANRLIKNNSKQLKLDAIANKKRGKDPVIAHFMNEDDEAESVAKEVTEYMIDNREPKEFAVLYRTNAQSRALEEAMIEREIPYVVLGSASFYDRREIKDILAYLRLKVNPDDDQAFERIFNKPNRWLGKAFLNDLTKYSNRYDMSLYESLGHAPCAKDWKNKGALELRKIISQLHSDDDASTAELIRHIRVTTDYDNWLLQDDPSNDSEDGENERIDCLNSLISVAHKFPRVEDFIEFVDNIGRKKKSDKSNDNKVKLMTVHRSKGLEFPVVFVVGVNSDLLPHKNAITEDDIEEERRLFYVAMTRAMDMLYISHTDMYQQALAEPSIFIDELERPSNMKEELSFL